MPEPSLTQIIDAVRIARAALRTRPPKMRDSELERIERTLDALIDKLNARLTK